MICFPHATYPSTNAVPYGEYIGYVHTHPNSENFSPADKDVVEILGGCGYVVTPTYKLKKYVVNSTSKICTVTPIQLSNYQKSILLQEYSDNWYNHFNENEECPDGFGCEDKTWPNGG